MKRENKKVSKSGLTEITGNRLELEPYLGQTLECEVFVTNSLGYMGEKRLITEVRIPGTEFYIKHLWLKQWNIPLDKIKHGYQKMLLKVVDYWDSQTGDVKYGVKYNDVKLRKPKEAKMVMPQWKLDEIENAEMLKESKTKAKLLQNAKAKAKKPFGKIRRLNERF